MTLHEENPSTVNLRHRPGGFWRWLPIGLLMGCIVITSLMLLAAQPPEWMFVALNVGWAIVALTLLVKLSGMCRDN
ncbi:hypothetical protein RGV33_15075 [Pseudomonas sp. Bout1]|uniref:hypothetical protein n=1 Tax=Pseudomonas sp. Bout1 TaxID=3048600 RepID=UPI002AB44999|nr:hypothetical protein [Pseudomonas sp. Bout1]MDY7532989.1 hypothetical protein [Pseudomonas sp. Bout1]MEB0185938.1 hypothetical protein [Pseudomonas sp. Bout1]